MRRRVFSLLVLGAALAGCSARASHDRIAAPATQPLGVQLVTVSLESPGIGALPGGLFGGAFYYAGEEGQPYAIRITNNTAARVEAVVTVDGRDVVSGQLGDYRKQRGYIIEPFGQVVVDGFRQSFEQVAAFRFTGLAGSYTALQGTPQHAGVIGVAVFDERPSRKKAGPLAAGPSEPFPASGTQARGGATSPNERRDGAGLGDEARGRDVPPSSAPAPFAGSKAEARGAAPSDDAVAAESEAPGSAADANALGEGGSAGTGFAPPPVPRNELGTEYGESQASSVHEVEFKRKRKRKPSAVISVFYDSARGLAARGVPIGGTAFQQQ